MNDVARRLAAAGLSEAESLVKARLFERASRVLGAAAAPDAGPDLALFVPGRIELFGKHTDYAGGRSLLCTVERGFCLLARPRPDARVCVTDAGSGEAAAFDLDPSLNPKQGHWSSYPMTVARRLARNFPQARRGADMSFVSDLPPASGMSSSSALLTAVFLALSAVNALERQPSYRREIASEEDLAGFLGTIENGQSFGALAGDRGVGTFGGSEDHTAMLCCQPGCVSQYRFCPVSRERVLPLPSSVRLVVGVSGVAAEKTGAALDRYNRVSLVAQAVLGLWRAATGRDDRSLGEAIGSSPEAPDEMRRILEERKHPAFPPAVLLGRFEQFHSESDVIVPAAADALASGRLDAVGALAAGSQRGAEVWLGNQVPETMELVRLAREEGAVAASAFGAGFGGSVWALVPEAETAAFCRRWDTRYRSMFAGAAGRACFFASRPGPPAVRL